MSNETVDSLGVKPLYRAVKTSRLYEQIVQQVEESILKGQLKPGDQLPADADDLFADLLFAAGKVVVQRTFRRPARLEDLVEARCRIPLAAKQIGRSSYECFAVFRGSRHELELKHPSDPPQSM